MSGHDFKYNTFMFTRQDKESTGKLKTTTLKWIRLCIIHDHLG